jgi:hypothetical protein
VGGVGDSALPSPGNIKGIVGERAGLAAFAGFLLLVKMLSKQTGDLLLRYHHDIMYCVRASQFDHSSTVVRNLLDCSSIQQHTPTVIPHTLRQ